MGQQQLEQKLPAKHCSDSRAKLCFVFRRNSQLKRDDVTKRGVFGTDLELKLQLLEPEMMMEGTHSRTRKLNTEEEPFHCFVAS